MPADLTFFDATVCIGMPQAKAANPPPHTAGDLIRMMDRAGIARAMVWHVTQRDGHPTDGNRLLMDQISAHRDRLWPCWGVLPNQTRELGDTDAWFESARDAGVVALRLWPRKGRFLLREEVLAPIIERMVASHLPLVYPTQSDGNSYSELYDLLAAFPDLGVILCDLDCWGPDREFRPLLERYPNVLVDIGTYFVPGGIEQLVADYGADRFVWGSGYPDQYPGGMMLGLKHARIPDDAKQAIASGNMERVARGAWS